MASLLDGVDQRTQLVGHNRLELLLFQLDGPQRYGINVFKVREVVSCPPLSVFPDSHESVVGVAHLRNQTIPMIDLQKAIGRQPLADPRQSSVIVTEYNRTVQGFLVPQVLHIVNKRWEEILLPPIGAGNTHFLTAVTHLDDEVVEILDVEKVLYNITGIWGSRLEGQAHSARAEDFHVLVADDSSVARNQVRRTLDAIGVQYTMRQDGRQALDLLQEWAANDAPQLKSLVMVISDVEMPEMDGYTLTSAIRSDPRLSDCYVLLHTSLSGVFNSSLLEKVDADNFLSKFDADDLAQLIRDRIEHAMAGHGIGRESGQ